jgi:sec-independent protein translocase protein TatB
MFNLGGGEILVILLIALIVLGPQRLPEAARKLGSAIGEVKRMANGFQNEIKSAFDDADAMSKVTPTTTPNPTPNPMPTVTDTTATDATAPPVTPMTPMTPLTPLTPEALPGGPAVGSSLADGTSTAGTPSPAATEPTAQPSADAAAPPLDGGSSGEAAGRDDAVA